MPTKKGGGGRQQNYDSHGRYCKTIYKAPEISKREKYRRKEENRRKEIYIRAKNSKDKYLFDVYKELEISIPGVVLEINSIKYDKNINDTREFDIVAKGCIIEVKGDSAKRCLSQFKAQKLYCEQNNKDYYVYAPDISIPRFKSYYNSGIPIYTSLTPIITKMKGRLKIK